MYYLYSNNLMSKNQFGFEPQKSTEDAINYVLNIANDQIQKKKFLLLISLDISGAFDNIWHPFILYQLRNKKCPKNIFNAIKSFLDGRKVIFRYGDNVCEKFLTKGCSQGSAIGPGLWKIIYDSLLNLKLPKFVEVIGFADDSLVLVRGDSIEQIEKYANESLKLIYNWGLNIKLSFNPNKTLAMLITRKYKYSLPSIKMNNVNITFVNHIKYLGVIIDKVIMERTYKLHN